MLLSPQYFMLNMKRLTVQIEETLLWKLLEFIGFNQSHDDVENIDEGGYDCQRLDVILTHTPGACSAVY